MAIKAWAEGLRPREKLLRQGARQLSDTELLAICLRNGHEGRDALSLAQHLLTEFGGLRELLEAPKDEIYRIKGLGPAKYSELQAIAELARRLLFCEIPDRPVLESPDHVRNYLRAALRDRPYEVFCLFFLDVRHHIIAFEELFRGTLDRAQVYPRELIRQIMLHNAAAVILVHNHPSGQAEPSAADIEITRTIRDTLNPLDVRVLDHLIVGAKETVSLAERGLV